MKFVVKTFAKDLFCCWLLQQIQNELICKLNCHRSRAASTLNISFGVCSAQSIAFITSICRVTIYRLFYRHRLNCNSKSLHSYHVIVYSLRSDEVLLPVCQTFNFVRSLFSCRVIHQLRRFAAFWFKLLWIDTIRWPKFFPQQRRWQQQNYYVA